MIKNIKLEISELIKAVVHDLYNIDEAIVIERPKSLEMGDIAIPVFSMSKVLKKSPQIIASEISEKLVCDKFASINVVGGYINIFLNKKLYANNTLNKVLNEKNDYGNGASKQSETVIVEYSSPNIAKPFHIGHIRTTLIGAALHRIYIKNGYNVVGINHLGDYGTQFGKLIVAIKMWGDRDQIALDPINKLLEIYIKFHEEAEKDSELDAQARAWFSKLENNDEEALELWKWIREVSLDEFNRVYDMFNIKFDSFAGESFYSDKMDSVIKALEDKNIITYEDGAGVVKLEEYGLPNALITKKDGSTLYITRDLAAAIYRKNTYDFNRNIYVVAHQQELHFKQLFKILELLGYEWAKNCKHVIFGMVSLEDGSLSTRNGRVIFLEDVLNKSIENANNILNEKASKIKEHEKVAKQIGIGAVVFQELFINPKKDYAFSWEKTLSFDGETAPYIQYTGVRIKSLLKNAGEIDYTEFNVDEVSPELWNIVTNLMNFEEIIENSADKYDPSVLAKYAIDLAVAFNKFYANCRIFSDNAEETAIALSACKATLIVLQESLSLLGIEIPEEM